MSDPAAPDVNVDLRGTVADSTTGAGIPGASVQLYKVCGWDCGNLVGSATTDATGRYVLMVHVNRCTATLISLYASAEGHRKESRGGVREPMDQNPQCRPEPQTQNFALARDPG